MFTTQCSGDLGIEVDGRVVAQTFIRRYEDYDTKEVRHTLQVFDLVRGGPHEVCEIEAGLNKMMAIARREGG